MTFVLVLAQHDIAVRAQKKIVIAIQEVFKAAADLPANGSLQILFGNHNKIYHADAKSNDIPKAEDPADREKIADNIDFIQLMIYPEVGISGPSNQPIRAALAKSLSWKLSEAVGVSPAYAEVDFLTEDEDSSECYSAGISSREENFVGKVMAAIQGNNPSP